MDRDAIEKELEYILERTKELIDHAYMCGYKDGYCECIGTKNKINNENMNKKAIQISVLDV